MPNCSKRHRELNRIDCWTSVKTPQSPRLCAGGGSGRTKFYQLGANGRNVLENRERKTVLFFVGLDESRHPPRSRVVELYGSPRSDEPVSAPSIHIRSASAGRPRFETGRSLRRPRSRPLGRLRRAGSGRCITGNFALNSDPSLLRIAGRRGARFKQFFGTSSTITSRLRPLGPAIYDETDRHKQAAQRNSKEFFHRIFKNTVPSERAATLPYAAGPRGLRNVSSRATALDIRRQTCALNV